MSKIYLLWILITKNMCLSLNGDPEPFPGDDILARYCTGTEICSAIWKDAKFVAWTHQFDLCVSSNWSISNIKPEFRSGCVYKQISWATNGLETVKARIVFLFCFTFWSIVWDPAAFPQSRNTLYHRYGKMLTNPIIKNNKDALYPYSYSCFTLLANFKKRRK